MYSLNNIRKVDNIIGFPLLLPFVILSMLPLSIGYIDCRISCRRCGENTEHPSVLEVYCAMCEECKQRRREKVVGIADHKSTKTSLKMLNQRANDETSPGRTESTAPLLHRTPQAFQALLGSRLKRAQAGHGVRGPQMYDDHQQYIPVPAMHVAQPPMQMAPPPILMQAAHPLGMYQARCPAPPMCSESEEDIPLRLPEISPTTRETTTRTTTTTEPTTTTATTTTTTTTATTKRHISIRTPCAKKLKGVPQMVPQMMGSMMAPMMGPMMAPMMIMPCMPPYDSPCIHHKSHNKPPQSQVNAQSLYHAAATVKFMEPLSGGTRSDYQYVYVGIPKTGLRSKTN